MRIIFDIVMWEHDACDSLRGWKTACLEAGVVETWMCSERVEPFDTFQLFGKTAKLINTIAGERRNVLLV